MHLSKANLTSVSLVGFLLMLSSCSSKPIIMTSSDVKVSREEAPKNCADAGPVSGTTTSTHATQEEALEDMKKEASHKGANFIKIEQFSDTGTAVTGRAFICP